MKQEKFVSIPQEIIVVRWENQKLDEIPAITRTNPDGPQVWNEAHKSWITFNYGDYIRIDNPKDIYPIKADYMKEKYKPANGE